MFDKILIANRGEIACRIIKTAQKMGVKTVAVYSEADVNSMHSLNADEAVLIGPAPSEKSYLKGERIIQVALDTGAQAIHPGYGFLSENPDFVEQVEAAGLVFIGPSASSIRKMGLKDQAKRLMQDADVPVVPGYHGDDQDEKFLASEADKIGYPVLIKARAGGGGKGMRLVEQATDFKTALASAQREGQASFGDPHVLIEKYITSPRHIEVQVFGDTHGNVVHLYERDCSLQRRHQKVIEEAPAPDMSKDVRAAMTNAAIEAAKKIDYQGAGTIEFIVDGSGSLRADGFWFMEMNTRLQVEHPVTEAVTGVDLVEWQLRIASGELLPMSQEEIPLNGHAFEARIYAEDPQEDFKPSPGTLETVRFAKGCRIDTGVKTGDTVSPFYDPMIAKITSHGANRNTALSQLVVGLDHTFCTGIKNNIGFLSKLAQDDDFVKGDFDTGLIARKQENLTKVQSLDPFDIMAAFLVLNPVDFMAPRLGWGLWEQVTQSLNMLYNGMELDGSIRFDGANNATLIVKDLQTTFSNISNTSDLVTAHNGSKKQTAMVSNKKVVAHVKSSTDQYSFECIDPFSSGDAHAQNSSQIISPMTGVVTVVHVTAGMKVEKGAPLFAVEAMKMEHVVVADQDGVIDTVLCTASDAVDQGQLLVQFVDGDT
ncbi:acetyl/propionyl/methylcrotonyl-CoA carboxylase subunit alpha [Amylibacter sp. SFDW26]|uniref:acetyl/propionyl/methylcrotonyl-CoA carboxylase subunit alpha n=1 Tax=Amylibacter sp. SFDW26 TaxID=2652722 RepID=UPI001262944C|nr:acetyl/propionyl/methylcrotonyl-CoA carboxylase subunit alpha [Amylibacter sp. SFDW26]KAB7613844.1 acetyl/propionyl/methylcrotonyl-CoA carboxylase subunit alpha [Amylibacter sp. SFDW26]